MRRITIVAMASSSTSNKDAIPHLWGRSPQFRGQCRKILGFVIRRSTAFYLAEKIRISDNNGKNNRNVVVLAIMFTSLIDFSEMLCAEASLRAARTHRPRKILDFVLPKRKQNILKLSKAATTVELKSNQIIMNQLIKLN